MAQATWAPRPPTHPGLTPQTPPIFEEGVLLPDPDPRPADAPADWRTVPMPPAVAALPRDRRGYPVFVTIQPPGGVPEDGRVDFRVLNVEAHIRCGLGRLCGLCGGRLTRRLHFIGGPMCVQNRVFGDGPLHEACARYALAVCPHLTHAKHEYSAAPVAGTLHDRNVIRRKPGRIVLYTTNDCQMQPAPGGKPVFFVADALTVEWYSPDGEYIARTRPTRYAQ